MTALNQPLAEQSPDQLAPEPAAPVRNVGDSERMISAIGGGVLALIGLSRRSVPGLVFAAVGGALVYRGVTGKCSIYSALGIDTSNSAGDGAQPEEYFDRGI